MTDTSLLPPNATTQERAIANTIARISDVPMQITSIYDPATCPAALLPWLAWAWSVDEWDSGWTEATKRAVLAASFSTHRIKGTVASVKAALAAAGYPGATIVEGVGKFLCDGTYKCDGLEYCGDPEKWAVFRLTLPNAITNTQAAQVKRIVGQTAPARCQLEALDFQQSPAICDGSFLCNGEFNVGVIQ